MVKALPNGVQTTSRFGPDPRFGMRTPVLVETLTETPAGRQSHVLVTPTATLSDPDDPLSVLSMQTVTSVNGVASTVTYDVAAGIGTSVSPEGRVVTEFFDTLGRLTERRVPALLPTTFHYDSRGRLYETRQGTRVTTTTFRSDGFVDNVTDPLGRQSIYDYDGVGRVRTAEDPDGAHVARSLRKMLQRDWSFLVGIVASARAEVDKRPTASAATGMEIEGNRWEWLASLEVDNLPRAAALADEVRKAKPITANTHYNLACYHIVADEFENALGHLAQCFATVVSSRKKRILEDAERDPVILRLKEHRGSGFEKLFAEHRETKAELVAGSAPAVTWTKMT